jgi:hypothetical protein
MLGGLKNGWVPEHKKHEQKHSSHEEGGDKESPKVCSRLKSCESLYMCPCAPRQKDFYIPGIPSNLENIPSVNTYMNIFYIP